jgi:hypothetical protein
LIKFNHLKPLKMRITGDEPIHPVETGVGKFNGLTIRQHFAAMFMQRVIEKFYSYDENFIARIAVKQANALIEAPNKSEDENTQAGPGK